MKRCKSKQLKTYLAVSLSAIIVASGASITPTQGDSLLAPKLLEVQANNITILINGNQVDCSQQAPMLVDGRTLVPLRAIFEALGATVDWNASTQGITAKTMTFTARGGADKALDLTFEMTIGQKNYKINGQTYTSDVAPTIINGSTMVPVRVVSESFGCDVDWDSSTSTVKITSDIETEFIADYPNKSRTYLYSITSMEAYQNKLNEVGNERFQTFSFDNYYTASATFTNDKLTLDRRIFDHAIYSDAGTFGPGGSGGSSNTQYLHSSYYTALLDSVSVYHYNESDRDDQDFFISFDRVSDFPVGSLMYSAYKDVNSVDIYAYVRSDDNGNSYYDTSNIRFYYKNKSIDLGNTWVKITNNAEFLTSMAIIGYTNKERIAYGLEPLKAHVDLVGYAGDKTRDMIADGYFSHTNTSGVSMAQKYNVGENIHISGARNASLNTILDIQNNAQASVTSWMNSEGHKANILSTKYSSMGASLLLYTTPITTSTSGCIATQMFKLK